jgi:hypothetical protein
MYIKVVNLPPGGGTLYAAQTVYEDFHSSPGGGACAGLPQNENSYMMSLLYKKFLRIKAKPNANT